MCRAHRQPAEHKQRYGQREECQAHASNGSPGHLALQGCQAALSTPDTGQHLIRLGNHPLDLLGGGDGALGPQLRCLTLEPSEGLLDPHDERLDGLGQSDIENLYGMLLELGGVDPDIAPLLHGLRELSRTPGRRRELLLDPRHHRVRIQVRPAH